QCSNNLKQIGLAVSNYESAHGTFPVGAYNCCWGTWVIGIFPYMEQQNAYDLFNHDKFPDGPRYSSQNRQITGRRYPTLTCPSDMPSTNNLGLTNHNYAANHGNT